MPITLRSLNIAIVITVLYFVYLIVISFMYNSTSPAGFLSRSTLLPSSTPLVRENLNLAVLRNAQIETSGFTLAIFSPNIAVTHFGEIHRLQEGDYKSILDLALDTSTLPTPERFYNAWVIDQPTTSQPIDRILIPLSKLSKEPKESYTQEYREVSVQGYEAGKTKLKEDVGGYTELPAVLEKLFGVVLEARKGGGEVDESVVGRVKELLGNVYWYVHRGSFLCYPYLCLISEISL